MSDISSIFSAISENLGIPLLPEDLARAGYTFEPVERITEADIRQAERQGRRVVILTRSTTSALRRQLREAGISYADGRGNAFIARENFPFLVERSSVKTRSTPTGKAFNTAGLKVVFVLLDDKAAISCTYRDLGRRAGVSAATVKLVVDDLARQGFVRVEGTGRGMRRWVSDRERLAKRWSTGFLESLRPELIKGRYRFQNASAQAEWFERELPHAIWGGEAAARELGYPLRPQRWTVYLFKSAASIIRALRLIADPEGEVELLEAFWRPQSGRSGLRVPSRILVYGDLVSSRAARNLDIATQVFADWLDEAS